MADHDYSINTIEKTLVPSDKDDISNTISMDDIRSEEITEIIGKMPNWIIRRGITIIASLCILILTGCYFFSYPDTMALKVIISSGNPPQRISISNNLYIQNIFVNNNQKVAKGQIIGMFSNPANYENVSRIVNAIGQLDTILDLQNAIIQTSMPSNLQLGELQSDYAKLYQSLQAYKSFLQKKMTIENISNQIFYSRQSEAKQKNIQLLQKEEKSIALLKQENDLSQNVQSAIAQFKNDYTKWEQKYIIKSHTEGRVSFMKDNILRKENLTTDEVVIMIFPPVQNIVVRGKLSYEKFKKIKNGQKALLKLQAYPYEEYGILEARTDKQRSLGIDTNNIVELKLKQGLTTNLNKTIPAASMLIADAEIITDEKSILERLFDKTIANLKQ